MTFICVESGFHRHKVAYMTEKFTVKAQVGYTYIKLCTGTFFSLYFYITISQIFLTNNQKDHVFSICYLFLFAATKVITNPHIILL